LSNDTIKRPDGHRGLGFLDRGQYSRDDLNRVYTERLKAQGHRLQGLRRTRGAALKQSQDEIAAYLARNPSRPSW
jgi:hypothetical protein